MGGESNWMEVGEKGLLRVVYALAVGFMVMLGVGFRLVGLIRLVS